MPDPTPSSSSGPGAQPAEGSPLVITGRVADQAGQPVAGVVVEASHAAQGGNVRLGSVPVDDTGAFELTIGATALPNKGGINLIVRVYGPDQAGAARKERLLFESEVRQHAGLLEHFAIQLDRASLKKAGLPATIKGSPAPVNADAMKAEHERLSALTATSEQLFEDRIATVKDRRDLFRDSIRGALAQSLSRVTDAERKSDRFVADLANIPTVASKALLADVATILGGDADPATGDARPPMERTGRLLLTKKQLDSIVSNAAAPVEMSAADLEDKLGVSLDKPSTIYRRTTFEDPCRPRTKAEECLDGVPGSDEGFDSTSTQPSADDATTTNVPDFDKKHSISDLMDRQAAPEDPLIFGPKVQKLEPALSADQVSAAIAGITFAPGPADVPALHYFNDLQIAFEPIWQEALDDRFLKDVEGAYDKFVERGGAPAVNRVKGLLAGGVLNPALFLNELLDIGTAADNSYETVSSVVLITHEEWDALPSGAKTYLTQIASQMAQLRTQLVSSISGSSVPDMLQLLLGSSTSALLKVSIAPFMTPDAIEIRSKLQLLKSDADGMVALARRLVLEVEASRPFRPTHTIIEDLRQQHQQAYPFRVFAASPLYRSVNFGLLVIYKQIWTLKAYQVGELVSTIPLAPKEVRKYSKRTLRKTKRAVQEVESRYERRTGESEERSRIETEIVQRAQAKTNFSMTATGTVSYGAGGSGDSGGQQGAGGGGGMGISGSNTTTFQRDVEKHSDSVKKEFNEAIRKATEEVKNERKTEISTEETFEEEVTQSGEIMNPNDEIPCTFLFYELQRRFGIDEKIHGLQSVVFVAQEVPSPSELDHAWLIRHDWILSRVLLDPSYAPALGYVSTTLISDDVALREMRDALFRQRKLVEDLKQDLADRRSQAGLRYEALQQQIERTAKSAEGGGGGLFGDLIGGVGDLIGKVPIVGDLVQGGLDMLTGEKQASESDQLREGAARDAFDREQREQEDVASRTMSAIATLESMQREYTERLARYLSQLGQVDRLIDHIWQNILYYMQAIWAHEPDDQRFLRLKDVPIPVFEKDKSHKIKIDPSIFVHATDLVATDGRWVNTTHGLGVKPPPSDADKIKTVPLSQVADIYKPAGVFANYLVFPMFDSNPITEFMMEPYVTLAEGEYGVSDPDPLGNMSLDEFADYVCCLRKHYGQPTPDGGTDDTFDKLKPALLETLKKLLQSSRREGDVVIPCEDGLYIEALPGAHSVMEQFKHLHRIIDVKTAQAEVRAKELDNVRRAERILQGELEDPDIEAKYVFEGGGTVVAPHP